MNYFSQVVSVKQRPQRKKQPFPKQSRKVKYFLSKAPAYQFRVP